MMKIYLLTGFVSFFSGFAIMVLEIIGARFLARDFGSTFYVWISQIGVVMIALGAGYYIGGWIADKIPRVSFLGVLLVIVGVITFLIPNISTPIIEYIVQRHPIDKPIPEIWQRLDPVIGSALVFLLPCLVLAMVSPFMIKILSRDIKNIGKISGFIIAGSTLGGIVGVFASGFLLIDIMRISSIFKVVGMLVVVLGLFCQLKCLKTSEK